jgi:hypothetical protein
VVLRDTGERVILGQVSGQSLEIAKSDIVKMKPSKVSLMPEGLLKGLSAQQKRDLLTFLLTSPPTEGNK